MQIKHYLSGMLAVNCYLVIDETTKKAFIVDPGGVNKQLINYVKEEGIDPQYIVLTHGHGDHIGGVPYYQKHFPGIKLIAHEEERNMLLDPRLNHSPNTCAKSISIDADIYVKDKDTLTVGELTLQFIHTPGHTKGGMSIYVENSLFSGDTLFAQSVGRTDFSGSSFSQLKDSIQNKLYTLPDETMVYPGHMGSTTIGFEKEHNPFV
jgi:hydroxyacylglutathione hydrolase